jgi:hypothetical protein
MEKLPVKDVGVCFIGIIGLPDSSEKGVSPLVTRSVAAAKNVVMILWPTTEDAVVGD